MVWKIELAPAAIRELDQIAWCILGFLHKRIAPLENPRSIGEALKGPKLGDFWEYRVGDYRIITSIEDNALLILVVRIGNRKEVYRK